MEFNAIVYSKLELLAKLWKQKDVEGIFNLLYVGETEISGQGTTNLFTGKANLTGLLHELVNGSTSVNLSIFKSTELSSGLVLTWTNWKVSTHNENNNFTIKSLFLWKKIEDDWKIIADMYADHALS